MSVTVHIDGQPAGHFERYVEVLDQLGLIPNESESSFEIWTEQPQDRATPQSVWLNPPTGAIRAKWLQDGGAIVSARSVAGATEDCLLRGSTVVTVRSSADVAIKALVLAAFLAHDFPLVDALMLARAYRGNGWPNDLSDYPVPVGGPASTTPFAPFPRNAGLYAVVPTSEWVHRLAESGVPVVQLRNKHADAPRVVEICKAIKAAAGTNTLLFINDDWRFAIEHGAYGIHLGQEDIDTADLAAIQRAGLRLGISTHGIYEMLRAHACKPSYLALGAIYATATKEMPTVPQGLRRLQHYVRLMSPHYPLVAIGGIDLSRISGIWATGVDCAAVLRAIVDASDYQKTTADLLATTPQVTCTSGAA
ncbi:MAG TPA: thiamine phosphate synthase [Acidobacteriaceae bacterium]|nr:thiamine phosphate synthase [Acidobacteriaceae bacterium]